MTTPKIRVTPEKTGETLPVKLDAVERLERVLTWPHRNRFVHWAAFVMSIISLVILIGWMFLPGSDVPFSWFVTDAVFAGLLFSEFFTRSGFRRDPIGYTISRFFDFVANVPVLVLVNHNVPGETAWVWVVLVARIVRAVDRILGDGFLSRNIFALIEGLEEEITDRVLLKIIARIRLEMDRGQFGRTIAGALTRNRSAVLDRVEMSTRFEGIGESVARIVGLDNVIRRAEERAYDAATDILNSPEVDRAFRDSIDSVFNVIVADIGVRTWRQHFGWRDKTRKK